MRIRWTPPIDPNPIGILAIIAFIISLISYINRLVAILSLVFYISLIGFIAVFISLPDGELAFLRGCAHSNSISVVNRRKTYRKEVKEREFIAFWVKLSRLFVFIFHFCFVYAFEYVF